MKKETTNIIFKVAAFSAAPAAIMYGLMFVFWETVYFTAPVLDPYVPYSTDKSDWSHTVFSYREWGNEIFAIHSIVIGCLSAYLSRSKSWGISVLIFFIVVIVSSIPVHAGLKLLGYEFFMETP